VTTVQVPAEVGVEWLLHPEDLTLLPPVGSRAVGVMQLELEDNHLAVFGVRVKNAW
jgi:hypothetical protein